MTQSQGSGPNDEERPDPARGSGEGGAGSADRVGPFDGAGEQDPGDSDGPPDNSRWYLRVIGLVLVAILVIAVIVFFTPKSDLNPSPDSSADHAGEAASADADSGADSGGAADTGEAESDAAADADELVPSDKPTQEVFQNEIHDPGQALPLGENWEVSIEDPTMDATKDVLAASVDNKKPEPGTAYALVYVTATNTSSTARSLYDEVGVSYFDNAGKQFNSARVVGPDDAYLLEPVEPGQTVRGSFVFEVPTGSEDGYWIIGTDTQTGSSRLVFANPSDN